MTAHDVSEQGVSMVATLMVVIILGVLAAIAFSNQNGPTSHGSAATGSTTPQSVGSDARAAIVAVCQADFLSVATAVQSYRAVNGAFPPNGTTWATSSALGGPYLQSWPTDARVFSISWDGSVLSAIPAKGPASHGSPGTSSPNSGCYAS